MQFVLEAVAITLVFIKGSIFKRVRESGPALWRELAGCPLCTGVWIGMFWHVLRSRPTSFSLDIATETLATGAITGVCALLIALTIGLLDRWS